ncbi:S41 family peptidase [Carnobacterium maltaromaticum]|uniref:S41 family peptidase n=1 Tax=Carnobacterium maltaromaticum TaxID=2751 RepID=UPI0039B044AA
MNNESEEKETQLNSSKRKTKIGLPAYIVSLLLVALIAAGGTYFVTKQLNENATSQSATNSGAKTEQEFAKLQEVYQQLTTRFFQKTDSNKLIEGAITGMVNSLDDPYSQYLNAEEATALNDSISSSFEGIGAEVMNQDDAITISAPIVGSPAEKAGLKTNDIILKADDKELTGLSLTKAVSFIRGEKGTKVVLTIKRGDQVFDVTVTRDTIPVETVKSRLDENDPTIGYIQITSFATPTYKEVTEAVEQLRKDGAKSFIFDVRQNPGGLLDQALQLSNMFVDEGKIIMQTQERGQEPQVIKADASLGDFKVTEPVTLLVDEGSASASEILAGAMKESGNVTVIGTKTFGKGTVQTVANLSDKSELKLTIAKWLTPEGQWIHKKGLEPTIAVDLPDYVHLLRVDPSKKYQAGDLSDQVKNLQAILKALGYTLDNTDGYFDASTTEAVNAFQTAHELPVDGLVTGKTADALVADLVKLIKENDTQYEKAVSYLQEK